MEPSSPIAAADEALAFKFARDREIVVLTKIAAVPPLRPVGPPSWSQAPTPPMTGAAVLSVMQCIKDHESGNYTESSHLSSGSGAFQYVPSTWREWSAKAGHPGFAYAFEAPAVVQDAVTEFTLTHGGAGNWSNKFGFDPCTQGMG